MLKKTALATAIGLALSATAQAAEDYRWELGAGYTHSTIDADLKSDVLRDSENIDSDIGAVSGTWYLKPVDTSKGPLAEAAFLDHASNITLSFADGEVDLNSINNDLSDEDGQTYAIDTRYVAEGPGWELSGWLVDLSFLRAEPGDREIDTYGIGIGKYITEKTTVVVNYEQVNVNNGGDTDGYSVDLEHMWNLSNGGGFKATASAGKVVVKDADDIESYALGGTYYLNKNLGFGAGYSNTSQNGFEVDGFDVSAQWFVTDNIEIALAYSQLNPDDIKFNDGDVNGKIELQNELYSLGALMRF